PISTVGFGNNGLAKANLHGANDQKVLAGGDRESVGAGFTDSGLYLPNRYSINASLRVILNREPSLYGAFLRLIFMTAIAPYRLNLLAKHVKRAKH
ncbi:hypothetical protein, partial [Halomonas sp. 15WGF]|uniref:hypothetical protein n=1 Tax=Halomonas sp. 15WGF TaxID=2570357 RepID=UPI0014853D08